MTMSTRDQIRQLRARRRQELRNLGQLFAHTRRDLTRAVSPERQVRKHLGIAMLGAALVGMLLAPAPRYARGERRRRKRRRSSGGAIWGLLGALPEDVTRMVPGLQHAIEEHKRAAEEAAREEYEDEEERPRRKRRKSSFLARLLIDALSVAAARVDWQGLVRSYASGRMQPSHDGHPAEEEASVVIADVGTVGAEQAPQWQI